MKNNCIQNSGENVLFWGLFSLTIISVTLLPLVMKYTMSLCVERRGKEWGGEERSANYQLSEESGFSVSTVQ